MLKIKGWTQSCSLGGVLPRPLCIFAVMAGVMLAGVFLSLPLAAQVQPEVVTEPKILSVFPAGGAPGKTVEAEVRGVLLEGAYSAWFEEAGLYGRVLTIEELPERFPEPSPGDPKPKTKSQPVCRVRIEVPIPNTAHPGMYALRLVTARGLSSSIPFRILTEPIVAEASAPHSRKSVV